MVHYCALYVRYSGLVPHPNRIELDSGAPAVGATKRGAWWWVGSSSIVGDWQVMDLEEPRSGLLREVAAAGDVVELRRLAALGADVNAKITLVSSGASSAFRPVVKDEDGAAALHLAAAAGQPAAVQALVELGATVHVANKDGATPLHLAAGHGQTETAQMLVELGAYVDVRDTKGQTPLQYAADRGRTKTVRALVDLGASLHVASRAGDQALHFAAGGGHTETVQALVELGAAVDAKDAHGSTPLHQAAYRGHTETVQALVELGAAVYMKDAHGSTTLHQAAYKGQTETDQALPELDASVDVRGDGGVTPLYLAAAWVHREHAEAMLAFASLCVLLLMLLGMLCHVLPRALQRRARRQRAKADVRPPGSTLGRTISSPSVAHVANPLPDVVMVAPEPCGSVHRRPQVQPSLVLQQQCRCLLCPPWL
jgi:ankyrin repeat protein